MRGDPVAQIQLALLLDQRVVEVGFGHGRDLVFKLEIRYHPCIVCVFGSSMTLIGVGE